MKNPCKIYYCYKATNDVNGKIYIGFAANPQQRWREHKRDADKNRGHAFHAAIRKYGWQNFSFEIICCGKNKRKMVKYIEPQLIDQHQSLVTQNGYNIYRKFAGRISPCSAETRRKLSELHKGNHYALGFRWTEESKEKMRTRHVSAETRHRISEAHKGKIISSETRQKLREINTGKKDSEEVRERKRIAAKKRGISPETFQKMHNARKKLTLDEIQIIYQRLDRGELQREIAKDFNVSSCLISKVNTGRNA